MNGPLQTSVAAGRQTRLVRLLVMEAGAAGRVARAWPDGGDQTILVAQSETDAPMSFTSRVVRRIQNLERAQKKVERAVLLLAPHVDAEVTAARLVVVRALITHVTRAGGGPSAIVLSVGQEWWSDSRHDLPTLLDALLSEAGRGVVSIGVELATAHTPSVLTPPRRVGLNVRKAVSRSQSPGAYDPQEHGTQTSSGSQSRLGAPVAPSEPVTEVAHLARR